MDKEVIKIWHEAYREIALCLRKFELEHPNDKEKTTAEHLFDRLNEPNFRGRNKWFVRGIEKWDNKTLDPIQVFAAFSHSKSNNRSRFDNIRIILTLLQSEKNLFEHEDFFEGCPTVMMSRPVTTRAPEYQEEIWELLEEIVDKGLDGLAPKVFEQYKAWYGIDIVSLTIFLFWIDSDNFISLDSSTRSFLVGLKVWDKPPYDLESYVSYCRTAVEEGVLRDIVRIGYALSQGLKDISFLRETKKFLGIDDQEGESATKRLGHAFKILAIQPMSEGGHCKNLKKGRIYQFYDEYEFIDGKDETIHFYENRNTRFLYRQNDIDVQVSAIVGKNGSGKSTLSELLFLAINLLSKKNKSIESELEEEQAYLNFYFFTNDLYKVSIDGDKVTMYTYKYLNREGKEVFLLKEENVIDTFDFGSFFYSIGINYSLYGLNENIIGYWIHLLFHKNDGYQVPLVLNPFRRKGIIDPNSEESLAKSRLLAHVLDLDRFELNEGDFSIELDEENRRVGISEDDIRPAELVDGKRPKELTIEFNLKKFNQLKKDYEGYVFANRFVKGEGTNVEMTLNEIFDAFWNEHGKVPIKATLFVEEVKAYIVYKLFSIGETYSNKYDKFIEIDRVKDKVEFIGLPYLYFKEIFKDTSHVTFKLWQAIHYLVHDHVPVSEDGETEVDILNFAVEINKLKIVASRAQMKAKSDKLRRYDPILFIPPSIFDVDIVFDKEHTFNKLSSGEKQSVFAINTVTYHLYNLDSIDPGSGLITYPYVNILFDEVELYFHPDMQRKFVFELLKSIGQLNLEKIKNIHIQFITHSPFILSDIPAANVIRIEDGNPREIDQQTFGANVHDLLHNDFFMNHFMGEFARDRIHSLINYLTNEEDNHGVKWNLEEANKLIDLVGEPFLKDDLKELFKTKSQVELNSVEKIEAEIQRLEIMRGNLQNRKK